jgi:hypothetical protein
VVIAYGLDVALPLPNGKHCSTRTGL